MSRYTDDLAGAHALSRAQQANENRQPEDDEDRLFDAMESAAPRFKGMQEAVSRGRLELAVEFGLELMADIKQAVEEAQLRSLLQ